MTAGIASGIKLGTHVSATASDEHLLFLRQLGIEHVRVHFTEQQHRCDDFARTRRRFEAAGLNIFCVVHPWYKGVDIALGKPERDRNIERFAGVMQTLVEVGFEGLAIPDHFPQLVGDENERAALAYSLGYMRALMERAKAGCS